MTGLFPARILCMHLIVYLYNLYSDSPVIARLLTYQPMTGSYVTRARPRTPRAKHVVTHKPGQALPSPSSLIKPCMVWGGVRLGPAEFQPPLGGSLNESRRVRKPHRQYYSGGRHVNGGTGVLVWMSVCPSRCVVEILAKKSVVLCDRVKNMG
jgi:hypothetical protein